VFAELVDRLGRFTMRLSSSPCAYRLKNVGETRGEGLRRLYGDSGAVTLLGVEDLNRSSETVFSTLGHNFRAEFAAAPINFTTPR
jgi:hypothetical protein